ncbi:MAG: deoxyribonuclease V [bacterium]
MHRHDWRVEPAEAMRIQERLAGRVVERDDFDPEKVRLVAGADISHGWRDDRFFAAVVVLTYPEMEIVEAKCGEHRAEFPYVPGLLVFREGPAILEVLEKLKNEPDLLVFDGHGVAHPRGIGIASHIGVVLDKPSIGCAKSRLVGEYREPGRKRGARTSLKVNGRVVGKVFRSKDNTKPIFISTGHRVGLETAVRVIATCVKKYRIPEPTRQAHIHSNQLRKESLRAG